MISYAPEGSVDFFTMERIGRAEAKSATLLLVLILASSAFAMILANPPAPAVSATPSVINLKALVITSTTNIHGNAYTPEIAEEITRDYGIPFDVVAVSSITASTFWDSANQANKYQFAIYFPGVAFSTESTQSSTVVSAVTNAIKNGTNFIFVGSGVKNWAGLFGLSSLIDCPTSPQAGGTCGNSGTVEFGVKHAFADTVVRGEPTWTYGKVWSTSGRGLPDIAMPEVTWNGTGTEFLNATASTTSTFYPNTIFRNYGANHAMIWWWGSTEGAFLFYREGWPAVFDNAGYGQATCSSTIVCDQWYEAMQVPVELFYYALQNVTKYDVQMMPWATDGSAEVIRAADHESLCQYTDCGSTTTGVAPYMSQMIPTGLIGELNLDLNGWSDSIDHGLSAGLPSGATNSPCTTGFVYNTQLPAEWGSRYALDCAKVDNMTATTNGGTSTAITTSHAVNLVINDGNSTVMNSIRILVSTSGTPSWTLSFTDSKGSVLWTSSAQTTSLSSATWVAFNNINFKGALTGYVNNIQGTDKLTLTVTSGTTNWFNQTSTQADWVVIGRSNWDIVYVDQTVSATKNYAGATAMVPDSIRMANGNLYPSQNMTVYLHNDPGMFHAADIVGETSTSAPSGACFETFFNATDWSKYGSTAIANFESLNAAGWQIETNGWTHAKAAGAGNDNDFTYGNGTTMSSTERVLRIQYIDDDLRNLLGAGNFVYNWAYGTGAATFYPATTRMAAAGYWYAVGATQNIATGAWISAGYFNTASSGGGSIYDADTGDKSCATGNQCWFASYNQTRDMLGLIETHSDMNYPANDYMQAIANGFAQNYDVSSTWFCGTTVRCFNFWNTTMYAMTNVKTFQWTSASNAISLTFYTGTSNGINNAEYADPIVFRLPEAFQGLGLTTATDNQTAGSLTNSTANWRYYQVNTGKKWTAFTFTYTSPPASVTVTTSPSGIAGALKIDSATYTSSQTFTWYVNSPHYVKANSPLVCGMLCLRTFSSWSDSGSQAHTYTVSGSATLTANYASPSPVPSGVVKYVQINITNSQRSPILIGTQIYLVTDWNKWNTYLDSNLDNVVFFDGLGNQWYAWNENGTNTGIHSAVWVKSQAQIAANGGKETIYLGLYPLGTNNYSPTGVWGEAPQLSSTYAQYDNGAKVFNYYTDFSGTSLPSGWAGSGYTVSNSLTLPTHTNYAYTSSQTFGHNSSQVLDFYGTMPTPNSHNVWACFGYVSQDKQDRPTHLHPHRPPLTHTR